MAILAISEQLVIAVLSAATAVLTSVLVPSYKAYKKKKKEYEQRAKTLEQIPQALSNIDKRLSTVEEGIDEINDKQNLLTQQQEESAEKFDSFETQQLKYIINDAFFGYSSVEEIPDEVLISASQCCDIYLGKGLNHETGARCKIIYAELERRQKIKANRKNEVKD